MPVGGVKVGSFPLGLKMGKNFTRNIINKGELRGVSVVLLPVVRSTRKKTRFKANGSERLEPDWCVKRNK